MTDVFVSKKKVERIGGLLYGDSTMKFIVVGYFKSNEAPCLVSPKKVLTTADIKNEWSFMLNNDYSD